MPRHLSECHRKILTYKANGYTTQRIAEETGLTPHAIDNHMGRIFRYLDVRNCPQAVSIGIKLEEISLDDIQAGAL